MRFFPAQIEAFRDLNKVWSDVSFVLIGASALNYHLSKPWRVTQDLDIAVAASLEEPHRLSRLGHWKRNAVREHEWSGPGGVRVDIIPAGPDLLSTGYLIWPNSGHPMNLAGMRLAFEHFVEAEVAPAVSVKIATIPVVSVLKMISYLDRPQERERDLSDLAHVLSLYEENSGRRFDDAVLAANIEYERAGAFLLGMDISRIVNSAEKEKVRAFLKAAGDQQGSSDVLYRMARSGPGPWKRDEEEGLAFIAALEKGLATS